MNKVINRIHTHTSFARTSSRISWVEATLTESTVFGFSKKKRTFFFFLWVDAAKPEKVAMLLGADWSSDTGVVAGMATGGWSSAVGSDALVVMMVTGEGGGPRGVGDGSIASTAVKIFSFSSLALVVKMVTDRGDEDKEGSQEMTSLPAATASSLSSDVLVVTIVTIRGVAGSVTFRVS
jgi:hypothetical protein